MRRTLLPLLGAILALFPCLAQAGPLVDINKYPAQFSLVLVPDALIQTSVNFFTQTGTPVLIHPLLSTYPFTLPAGVPTDVGPSFNGNPLGVYRSFALQYQSYLGVSTVSGVSTLVALLRPGVGLGKTFNEVFGDQFLESDVIDAIHRLPSGDTSGVGLLFDLMLSNLDDQPLYRLTGPDTYTLDPAELVGFSTGRSFGVVRSGGYVIPSAVVPEPGTLTLATLGIAASLLLARRPRSGQRAV